MTDFVVWLINAKSFFFQKIYIWKANYGFPENIRKILREIFKEFISVEAAGFGPAKTNF